MTFAISTIIIILYMHGLTIYVEMLLLILIFLAPFLLTC